MDKTFENILDRAREIYRDPAAALAKDVNLTNEGSIAAIRVALIDLFSEEQLRESEDERMYARVTERYTRIEKYYLCALGETEANKVLKECEEEELWIKNLLEKQREQQPEEWSYPYGKNETADRLVSIAECLEMDGDCLFNGYSGTECGKFLRELARKQIGCKPAEWSEEDETMIKSILFVLESYVSQSESASSPSLITTYPTYYKEIDWLKSLRPSWKPSKKQMEALGNCVLGRTPDADARITLEILWDNLQKLL